MIGPGVPRTASAMSGSSGAVMRSASPAVTRSNARLTQRAYVRWRTWSRLMNHIGVICCSGTQPRAYS